MAEKIQLFLQVVGEPVRVRREPSRFQQLLQPDGRSPTPFHSPLLSSTKRTLFFGAAAEADVAAALPDCCYGLLSWGPFYKEPFNIMLP